MTDLNFLFESELKSYPKAAENYKKLELIETKEFDFESYRIYVHFNPARAVSSLRGPVFYVTRTVRLNKGALTIWEDLIYA